MLTIIVVIILTVYMFKLLTDITPDSPQMQLVINVLKFAIVFVVGTSITLSTRIFIKNLANNVKKKLKNLKNLKIEFRKNTNAKTKINLTQKNAQNRNSSVWPDFRFCILFRFILHSRNRIAKTISSATICRSHILYVYYSEMDATSNCMVVPSSYYFHGSLVDYRNIYITHQK